MNEHPPEDFRKYGRYFAKDTLPGFGYRTDTTRSNRRKYNHGGNIPPGFPFSNGSGPGHDVEHPPIEVIEWNDRVIATCELKGLFDEHINVAIAENTLHIIGFDGKIRYKSSAPLPLLLSHHA
jgi:hypothetical protein